LLDYMNNVSTIMSERNIDNWEAAEKIYLEENKDVLNNPLLDFNDPTLGTGINFKQNQ